MRTLDQVIADLPPERKARVMGRARQLAGEEKALRQLRQARDFTQQNLAKLLNIDQAGISKLESRSDMLLSTLQSYVEAMGGSLRLIAEFPDGVAEVSLNGETTESTNRREQTRHPAKPIRPALVKAE